MKKAFFTLILSLLFLSLFAQDFEIVSVESLPADMSAREEMKTDHNDRQCALLRVATQNIAPNQREAFSFVPDLGSEVVERATRDGEIWLWVSPGLKYLRVKHRDWGQYELRLIDHVARVESLHTYKIIIKGTLTLPMQERGSSAPTQQYLAFRISPTNATLFVNDELWEVGSDGSAVRFVKFGTYNYRVMAPNYLPETGTVTVNDPDNTQTVPVSLKPDFVEVTLKVDADAEIWVNNEKKGTRTWTGKLGKGNYKIECKQTNHETSTATKEITAAMDGQTITLPAPRPIYGALNVESTPNFCKLYIDGKDMGTTPKSIAEILIGQHEIKLTKDGYADYTETVTITKGERKQVKATLSNGKEIQFTCNVPNAQLEIDGKRMNSANGTYMLTYGQHNLRATAADYREYTYTLNVSESGSRSHSITMQAMRKDEETFTVNGISFTMKLVEGGTFQMGSNDSDAERDEKPVHSVTLSNYCIGETEVTQALWKAVMGNNPSYFKGDNLPVEQVSWNDCQEFIRKLNQKTGKNFRLPTEAEWEYAARGGSRSNGTKYAGSSSIGSVAWYDDNNGNKTHAVKGKSPNELGLYDLSGNVWEWCSDWYGSYGSGPQTNPKGPSSGSTRVLRGGCWGIIARHCRVSSRSDFVPGYGTISYGFRLCLSE
jgi:formylglycine-generating enzyme required for sulfatase activity